MPRCAVAAYSFNTYISCQDELGAALQVMPSLFEGSLQRRKQADRDSSCHLLVFLLPLFSSYCCQLSQNFRGN